MEGHNQMVTEGLVPVPDGYSDGSLMQIYAESGLFGRLAILSGHFAEANFYSSLGPRYL